ncbi:DUF2058 family protein [Lysobacter koreensis]|uniref:DUF2058 family protein n=1 Tax=Lysobacter koreensis TaxID=266122 RepID=A0ABW2YK87_9GAMM
MSHNLRDQLLGLGFKPAPKPERKPETPQAKSRRPEADRAGGDRRGPARAEGLAPGKASPKPHSRPNTRPGAAPNRGGPSRPHNPAGCGGAATPRSREDIDLAKAYAIRAQREKDERLAAEQAKQEEARLRREARAKLAELVKDQGLNAADAEIARHFPYGGKIKRIYVTAPQLKALNAGELGVLQLEGRYVLVTAELLAQAEAVFAPAVALKVDPNAPAEDDPYADPQYQVPDDLVW